VRVRRGGLQNLGRFVRSLGVSSPARALIVSDARVSRLYGARAGAALRRAGIAFTRVQVASGERAKSIRQLDRLWRAFSAHDLDRDGVVIALGGGAVGDLAGFAAATWQRGVRWVTVPTTLLAQVDASVGGKTAVDLPSAKNPVGAFHQPIGVLVDPGLLATLPARQLRAGMAEVVKAGMAVDTRLFVWLERHASALAAGAPRVLDRAVEQAIRAKARIVMRDERDVGDVRSALNFGHTLGHAIETACAYRRVLHGEAVAIGMRVAARLSVKEVRLPESSRARLDALLDAFGLPSRMPPVRVHALWEAMARDKKRRKRGVRWVLTPRIGHASVPRLITRRLVRAALLEAGART